MRETGASALESGPLALAAGAVARRRVLVFRACRVVGRVVDGGGAPVAAASVRLYLWSGVGRPEAADGVQSVEPWAAVDTAADGRFAVPVRPGPFQLIAERRVGERHLFTGRFVEVHRGANDVGDLFPQPGARLAIRLEVVDGRGVPVAADRVLDPPEVPVTVRPWMPEGRVDGWFFATIALGTGGAVLEGLDPTRVLLIPDAGRHARPDARVRPVEDAVVSMAGGDVEQVVRVVADVASAAPVPFAIHGSDGAVRIHLIPDGGGPPERVSVARGRAVAPLQPGRYRWFAAGADGTWAEGVLDAPLAGGAVEVAMQGGVGGRYRVRVAGGVEAGRAVGFSYPGLPDNLRFGFAADDGLVVVDGLVPGRPVEVVGVDGVETLEGPPGRVREPR